MKMLVYELLQSEDESGVVLSKVNMQWSEANEEIAKMEAYQGEYTIEDVDIPELEERTNPEAVLDVLLGVSE